MTWYRVHFRKKQIIVDGDEELARIQARKVPKVILVETMTEHRCSVCGKIEAWLQSWSWYGSHADLDDGRPILKFCSAECQERHGREKLAHVRGENWGESRHLMGFDPVTMGDRDRWREIDDAKRAANPRLFPWPVFEKIADLSKKEGQCRWCGERITSRYAYQRSYHDEKWGDARDCKREVLLHIDLDFQIQFLIARDGPGCQLCEDKTQRWVDAGPFSPWMGGEGNWIRWGEKLEVDHIVELWSIIDLPPDERRAYFGPDNLWLLCLRHHRWKSKREAADRAARRSQDLAQ